MTLRQDGCGEHLVNAEELLFSLRVTLHEHGGILSWHSEILLNMEDLLVAPSRTLDQHGKLLIGPGESLGQHVLTLDQHGGTPGQRGGTIGQHVGNSLSTPWNSWSARGNLLFDTWVAFDQYVEIFWSASGKGVSLYRHEVNLGQQKRTCRRRLVKSCQPIVITLFAINVSKKISN